MTLLRYLPVAQVAGVVLLGVAVAVAVAAPSMRRGERARALRSAARVLLAGIASSLGNVNHTLGLVNLAGNVVMFAPIGLLLVLAFGTRWRTSTLACVALSVSVELVQWPLGRSADVDDVLLNTIGGALGAALGVLALTWFASARAQTSATAASERTPLTSR